MSFWEKKNYLDCSLFVWLFPPQIGLALRKNQELTKPMASCLLQRQLSVAAAAAAMATMPPFPLRPASSPALFQSQPIPQALLHPAPGPICSTHTSVLFSPYSPRRGLNQLWTAAKGRPETWTRCDIRQGLQCSWGVMDQDWRLFAVAKTIK